MRFVLQHCCLVACVAIFIDSRRSPECTEGRSPPVPGSTCRALHLAPCICIYRLKGTWYFGCFKWESDDTGAADAVRVGGNVPCELVSLTGHVVERLLVTCSRHSEVGYKQTRPRALALPAPHAANWQPGLGGCRWSRIPVTTPGWLPSTAPCGYRQLLALSR